MGSIYILAHGNGAEMDYDSALKREVLFYETTRVNFEKTMLSDIVSH